MYFRISIATALYVAFLLGNCKPAAAQFLFAGYVKTEHDIKAGLDEPTRRLIEGLPAEVKTQVLSLLRDALPLMDKSVYGYLDRVDEILNSNINHLICGGQALAKGAAEQVTAAVLQRRPTPLLDLQREFDQRENRFASKPLQYLEISYEDYLGDTATTACQTREPPSLSRIDKLRATARIRWKVWNDLSGRCDSPSACLDLRYVEIKQLVANSEKRDLDKVKAYEQLAAVKQQPVAKPGPLSAFFRKSERIGPWIAYEDELLKLKSLEAAVTFARETRLNIANNAYGRAMSMLEAGEASSRQARSSLSPTNRTANTAAAQGATAVSNGLTAITTELNIADENSLALQANISSARARLLALTKEAAAIGSDAKSNEQKIVDFEARQEERERRKAEREAAKYDKFPK